MKSDYSHGGDIRRLAREAGLPESEILDYSANLNPLGFPEWLRPLLSSRISGLSRYPDPYCAEAVEAFAEAYAVDKSSVIAGNGATELLFALPRAGAFKRAVIPEPAYVDYRRAAMAAGLEVKTVHLEEATGFELDLARLEECLEEGDLVFLGNPNNPTGKTFDSEALRALAARRPSVFFMVDESFAGFVEGFDSIIRDRPSNVAAVVSFTKLYAVPGLRLGFAVAEEGVAETLKSLIPPWTANTLAQEFGCEAARDTEYVERTRKAVARWRAAMAKGLAAMDGLYVFEGQANFLLARMDRKDMNAYMLRERLLKTGVAIRVCENFEGLDDRYFRLAVRPPWENEKLLDALSKAMDVRRQPGVKKIKRKTPALMFQGVSSNSGKSVLTAAFCRILAQDGYRVAPFKAQNMALNSCVTLDGKEIGRAQVVQAQASGLEPDARMNPVLLKPNSDTGSQVIVMGEPVGNMNVAEYFRYKEEVFSTVKEAYDSLAGEYDAIVMEGAGSPAEVNLKKEDIVNMPMARHAGARALLVGDIDRGGVFASFIGCMETMAEWERDIMAGFVINKFRGDASLLDSAMQYTQRFTGKTTFGVVPYIKSLYVPDEDQASMRPGERADGGDREVTIAVVRLRHISNFTDFDPLMMEPDVRVVWAVRPEDLEGADVVVIPGSKNVVSDLRGLLENGLGAGIQKIAAEGRAEVVGVCGGFQAMGASVADPHGIESASGRIDGLNLLPVETTLETAKTLVRADGVHMESGLAVSGYEIHHGRTQLNGAAPSVTRGDGEVIGAGSPGGLAWGTYMHGIFNDDRFRRWFIDRARVRKGREPVGRVVVKYDIDEILDGLADVVRDSLRVKDIYRLIGI